MHFTNYQITGGKVFAVNPHDNSFNPMKATDLGGIEYTENLLDKLYAFEAWQSTQPPITADPSIKDGVYAKELFEEPVWQILSHSGKDAEYITVTELTAKMSPGFIPRLYLRLKQPVNQEEKEGRTCTDEFLKSLPFHDKYFSNEIWHPDESDIADMGKDCYDEAMAEWQVLESNVLFDGFRVHFESCDCGDGYGCSHGSYPYDLVHPFVDTDMCWEDDGFYIESPSGLIRFDKTEDITMYHFVKACELLNLKLTFK